MIVEERRAEKLAKDPEFRRVWHMHISLKEKSERLKAGPKTVREAAKLAGFKFQEPRDLNVAPTDEEEESSLSSLALAPMVAERAREVTRLQVQFMRGEIESFPWDKSPHRRCLFVNGKVRGGS